ncbi:MAG: efflux RND transporter periplasmic adaptor subunit [Syntrophobacteraceae bacterium]
MNEEKISKLKIADSGRFSIASRKRRIVWVLVVAVVLVVCALLFGKGLLNPATSVRASSAGLVYPSQVITDFNASGYVVAQRKAAVASKGTGRIVYLGVQEGSRVKEGEVIARLDNDDLKAEKAQIDAQLGVARSDLARAEIEVATSERNFKRYTDLWAKKAVAQLDYENAQDRFLKAKAAVESARAAIKALEASSRRAAVLIEYTIIRAPFDGVVLTKDADVGEVVAPFGSATNAKAAVVTMADLSSLMVQADVAESFLNKVRPEQPCEIQLDAVPNTRFAGRVHMIVPTADRTRGTVMVKVRLDVLDPRVLPEMSAKAAFLSRKLSENENQPVLAVHKDALASGGGRGIFRVVEGKAEWIPVNEPRFMGDYLVLGPPVQSGDRIILKPPAGLKSGERVEIAE